MIQALIWKSREVGFFRDQDLRLPNRLLAGNLISVMTEGQRSGSIILVEKPDPISTIGHSVREGADESASFPGAAPTGIEALSAETVIQRVGRSG